MRNPTLLHWAFEIRDVLMNILEINFHPKYTHEPLSHSEKDIIFGSFWLKHLNNICIQIHLTKAINYFCWLGFFSLKVWSHSIQSVLFVVCHFSVLSLPWSRINFCSFLFKQCDRLLQWRQFHTALSLTLIWITDKKHQSNNSILIDVKQQKP